MSLRVCLVTPFSWSQPHEVNEHVAASASALERLGHRVAILAPSNRAGDLAAGRRALRRLERHRRPLDGLVALGPAVPVSRTSSLGVPVGVRANLTLALSRSEFDVLHAHDPGVPSLSYLALRDSLSLTVATFHSADRLAYPPGRAQRAKLLARLDALSATSGSVLTAARARFPGEYVLLPTGIDTTLFRPSELRPRLILEWHPDDRSLVRALLRSLRSLPELELVILRTRPLSGRPYVPLALRGRVRVETALAARERARALAGAQGLIPSSRGSLRLALEARVTGVAELGPVGERDQLEELPTLLEEHAHRRQERERQATALAESESPEALGAALEDMYTALLRRRRRQQTRIDRPRDRPWILCDLHLHTEHSYDCSVPVPELLEYAEGIGLGAIAITDHNVFAGALEAVELAGERNLVVIPGEEVKTDQGEVIGLFLEDEIAGGMSMAATVDAIRAQGGLVYLPHPFDRLHTIPDAPTLHRLLPEIDVFEVHNARLLFEGFNEEALRFARKYNLLMGAGSDAHVLQGVGTGMVRMRAFESAEEFLNSLRSAEIVQRPKSLIYLQGLKWMAQTRERRARAPR